MATRVEFMEPTLFLLPMESFAGELEDDLPEGFGRAVFCGGATYEGTFERGMLHGQGKYCWPDGAIYEGSFVDNTITGRGTITWPDGSRYQGEVAHGLRHGSGKFQSATRQVMYTGAWQHGVRHGRGELFYDAQTVYTGEWRENRRHGRGRMEYRTGNSYDGDWADDERHGRGTMTWADRHESYTGDFVRGEMHGHGEYVYSPLRMPGTQYFARNRYVGDFSHGKRHGHGTFYYADESVYTGPFVAGRKHGDNAVFVYPNGVEYRGSFVDDNMVGPLPPHCHDELWPAVPDLPLADADATQLVHVGLRHIGDLRTIYTFYSRLGATSADNVYTLRRLQWHCALTDFDVEGAFGMSLARADEICAGVLAGAPYDGEDCIPFRDFINSFIAISHTALAAKHAGSPFPPALALAEFIEQHVLPRACRASGLLFSGSPPLLPVYQARKPRFAALQKRYCTGTSPVVTARQGLDAAAAVLGDAMPAPVDALTALRTHVTPLVLREDGETFDLTQPLTVGQLAVLVLALARMATEAANLLKKVAAVRVSDDSDGSQEEVRPPSAARPPPPAIVFAADDEDDNGAVVGAAPATPAFDTAGVPPGVDPTVHAITTLLARTAGWV